MLEKEVIEPRNQERYQGKNPYYRYDMEPFRVRRKDFWLLSTVTKLLNEFIPKLSHDADGLIFQGWDDPYVPRTHEGLLKWKYADLDSVDFLFEIDDDRQLLFLYERGKKKLMEGYIVAFEGIRCNNCQNVGATSGDFIQLTCMCKDELDIGHINCSEVSIQRLHENTDRSLRTYLSNGDLNG
ncbi:mRNA-capping enzyme [Trifolium repens]|nr:mRNA-capping enzyme [Trifolium repens]